DRMDRRHAPRLRPRPAHRRPRRTDDRDRRRRRARTSVPELPPLVPDRGLRRRRRVDDARGAARCHSAPPLVSRRLSTHPAADRLPRGRRALAPHRTVPKAAAARGRRRRRLECVARRRARGLRAPVRPIVRRVGLHVAVLACLGAVAVAYTWPLAAHVRSHYLLREAAPEGFTVDLLFSSWILASDTRQLVNDPLHVFETNNLHPFRHTLAFGENMIGVALLVLPVQLLGDDPTLTHNVAMLACIVLTAWGVFLLVRELGGSALAAFVAGVLAIYSPPLWSAILLLPLVAAQWTPLALFCLVRLVRTHRWRWSALLGLAVAAAVWSSLQHGFFLIFGLAITVPVFAALSRHARQALPHAIAAGALAALLCVPIVQPYRAVRWELDTEAREGASWFALRADGIAPPFTHPLRHLAERLRSGEHVQDLGTLAPWILIGAGAVALAVRRRRGPVDVAAVVAVVAGGVGNLLFAFGPADPGGGWSL